MPDSTNEAGENFHRFEVKIYENVHPELYAELSKVGKMKRSGRFVAIALLGIGASNRSQEAPGSSQEFAIPHTPSSQTPGKSTSGKQAPASKTRKPPAIAPATSETGTPAPTRVYSLPDEATVAELSDIFDTICK